MSADASTERAAAADACLRLAARAADEGAYARVSELYGAACREGIAPLDVPHWHRLLIEAGDFRAAADIAPPAAIDSGAAGAERCEGDTITTGDDLLDFDPGARETEQPLVAAEVVDAFVRRFAGRADVYARQWYDARRDRSGYWPVREPLSPRVVEQHLLGRLTVGQYVLHSDSTVSFAAFDLDPTPEALEQSRLAADGEGALASPPLVEYAQRILAAAERAGLAAFAEDTGGVGLHIWLFFAPRIAAERARALLRELLWRAGAQPPAVGVELFPKQDHLSGKGLGNLIKLPLGVHQATARGSRFLDRHLRPIPDGEGLAALRPCAPAAIEALLASRVVALRPPRADGTEAAVADLPQVPVPQGPTPRALAVALAAIPPGRPAADAADRVLARCAVVRELARQALEEHQLSANAARALLYSVGLIGRENERIEALFANAGISRKELERVRRGLQGPIGCRKLREGFPSLCHGCACPEPPPGGYATPALFALAGIPRLERRAVAQPLPAELTDGGSDTSLADIEHRLRRIEGALEKLIDREQTDGSQ